MSNIDNNVSRKEFLNQGGRSLLLGAIGTVVSQTLVNKGNAQTQKKPLSPPAEIPQDVDEPIVLERWKSDADQKSAPTPTPLPPSRRIGYAIVGLGHLSLEELLPALSVCEKSKLVALVSGSPEKLKKVAAQYGIDQKNCYSYEQYDNLKDNKEVDVIYIVLPNGLHREYVIRGAKAGKHILCEKPMANTSAECQEMIAACKRANVKLMVAYRIQFQPHNRMVREMLESKEFGIAKYIEAHNSQSTANVDHWRHKKALAGGGSLPDIGIYCLNTTRFITGEEPTEVFAYQYSTPDNPLFEEVEEHVSWQMKFPGGLVVSCATDYLVHESRRYRVNCEKGWINLENAYAYKGQKLTTSRADGMLKRMEEINIAENNQFGAEMDYFSECILDNKPPLTPGEEGLQDHIIMEAIYRSAAEGQPIKIQGVDRKNTWQGSQPS